MLNVHFGVNLDENIKYGANPLYLPIRLCMPIVDNLISPCSKSQRPNQKIVKVKMVIAPHTLYI